MQNVAELIKLRVMCVTAVGKGLLLFDLSFHCWFRFLYALPDIM